MENITINDILYVLFTSGIVSMMLYALYQAVADRLSGSKYADAVNAIYNAVAYVNQTFVDSLKESGSFDTEAQKQAFLKAKEAAIETMQASTLKWLEKSYVNLDEWFTVQIESAVKAAK